MPLKKCPACVANPNTSNWLWLWDVHSPERVRVPGCSHAVHRACLTENNDCPVCAPYLDKVLLERIEKGNARFSKPVAAGDEEGEPGEEGDEQGHDEESCDEQEANSDEEVELARAKESVSRSLQTASTTLRKHQRGSLPKFQGFLPKRK